MSQTPVQKLEDIEVLYNVFEGLRKDYDLNANYIHTNRGAIHKLAEKTPFSPRIPRLPILETVKFDANVFWMDTLCENLKQNINTVRERSQELNNFLYALESIARIYNIELPPKTTSISPEIKCNYCLQSILPCDEHPNIKEHKSLYVNGSDLARLPEPREIALDVECVNTIDYNYPTKKMKKIALRVAAFANAKTKDPLYQKTILVYHSYWRPEENYIKCYKDVSGIDHIELKQNLHKLYDRKKANDSLNKYISKNSILIFNAANDDVKCLNITGHKEIRDIQSYFCRYPYMDEKRRSPVALKKLSKYILWSNIQEFATPVFHCPVIDSRHTLLLYNKIPKEHWQKVDWPTFQPIPELMSPVLVKQPVAPVLTTMIEKVPDEEELKPSTSTKDRSERQRNLNYDDFNCIDLELDFEPNYESDEDLFYTFS